MFGGIVDTTGEIIETTFSKGCLYVKIKPHMSFKDIIVGDSIAVNGVCLTVTEFNGETFNATIVPETLRLTNLIDLKIKDVVNIERSLQSNQRIGGHQVQGHVDSIGKIISIQPDNGDALLVKISLPTHLSKYVVNKGYITLDGMSITVIDATPEWFTVTFIPHTQAITMCENYRIGTSINIEVDIAGKYFEKLLEAQKHASNV